MQTGGKKNNVCTFFLCLQNYVFSCTLSFIACTSLLCTHCSKKTFRKFFVHQCVTYHTTFITSGVVSVFYVLWLLTLSTYYMLTYSILYISLSLSCTILLCGLGTLHIVLSYGWLVKFNYCTLSLVWLLFLLLLLLWLAIFLNNALTVNNS